MNPQQPQFQQFTMHQPQLQDVSEPQQKYKLIACVDLAGGYSKEGKIPWHYREDMQWFKEQTTGHIVVMGLNTYNDMIRMMKERNQEPANPVLPNRDCYVVSSTADALIGVTVVKNLWDVKNSDPNKKIFIIGGGRLWREAIAMADQVIMTVIDKEFDCDQHFPTKYLSERFIESQVMKASTTNDLRFITWNRIAGK